MITRNFKSNITDIPIYLDGYFTTYALKDNGNVFPIDRYEKELEMIPFEELSITDRLRMEADQKDVKLTLKLRTAEYKDLTSMHLVEINDEVHKVFNVYHFKNKDGFSQTDITLVKLDKEVEFID